MLREAVELQQNAVSRLVELIEERNELTFRAPTGSGKTYMMADFMNRILENTEDVVFLVSTLSKGNLARQNFDKFQEYKDSGRFKNIIPYLISSEISGEESLFVPTDYNVYVLPRDLYKSGGRLMQGSMDNFLQTMTLNKWLGGKEKKIYLIKDECHVATNNLDTLSSSYFDKVLNFSATPKLSRRQVPDVEITDTEAVNAKLIKYVELSDEEDISIAINKFEEIKEQYRNLLGVNPCLIIQISNKEKADEELNNIIFPELNKAEHQDLKWMLIVDKEDKCNTNDTFKAKKLPVSKWKDYAKENSSTIDIIIFKMVISEGWDIPRACMLFQIRDSKSKQLDEQVIGRVRRNPRLLDFENLSDEAQKLAMTSWVWGIIPEDGKKVRNVKLFDEQQDFINNIQIKTTILKNLSDKIDFNVEEFLKTNEGHDHYMSIFEMFKKLNKADNEIKKICYDYSDSYQKWWKFNENIDKILTENNKYECDYLTSMTIKQNDNGDDNIVSFPIESMYVDNGNYVNINDWVWRRNDGADKFSFDSEAEREWASILQRLSTSHIKKITTGKLNSNRIYATNVFGEEEQERLEKYDKYLWGKNYISNSDIKFEYYLNGKHSSYPDFVLVDNNNKLHLFEVKSVNFSNTQNANFDSESYKKKVDELKKCYLVASSLTNQIFYLPVLRNDVWNITKLENGTVSTITLDMFEESFN